MKIVTWNCNRAFVNKCDEVFALDPDIAVIQECEQSFVPPRGYKALWVGAFANMGLAVFSKDPGMRLDSIADANWTFYLPVVMPTWNLKVLAVWAFHGRERKFDAERQGYLEPVLASLGPWLAEGRSMMLGDFNHNLKRDTPRGKHNFRPVVHQLRHLGLRSAYHESTLEGFNNETQATHLFRRNPEAKYHIDYCFLHHSLPFKKVQVMNGDRWTSKSDHLPISIEINDA